MRRHRRGGARLSLQLCAARSRRAGVSRARSRSRASSACRSSSIPATPTTTWRRFSRTKWGRGAFSALLHCFTGSRALAETGLELGLSISFSGVVTFKNSAELRAIARDVPLDRMLVETDAPYLAPVPHRGKRNEPAFVGRDSARRRRDARHRARGARRRDARQHACHVRQARPRRAAALSLRLTILGCGSSAGVPRVGAGVGRVRSGQSEATAADAARSSSSARRRRRDDRAGRHVAGPARTIDRRRGEAARRHSDDPSPCRPYPRDRRSAAAGPAGAAPHRHPYGRADVADREDGVFLYFSDAAGQLYPPIATDMPPRPGQALPDRGRWAARSRRCLRSRPWRDQRARLSLRRARLYARRQAHSRGEPAPCCEGLDVWIVDALRYRPHPSHFSLDEALAEIEADATARAILTNLHTDLDYETLRARLPRACHAGL